MDKANSQSGTYSAYLPNLNTATQLAANPIRRRLRAQYVAARFPTFASAGRALDEPRTLLRFARALFDDGEAWRAIELLRLCIEENHHHHEAWLALIELSFMQGDPGEFCELIIAFALKFPGDATLATQRAMAHQLAPHDPTFASAPTLKAMPNWSADAERMQNAPRRAAFHAHLMPMNVANLGENAGERA